MNTTQQSGVIVTGVPSGIDLGMTQAPLERGPSEFSSANNLLAERGGDQLILIHLG